MKRRRGHPPGWCWIHKSSAAQVPFTCVYCGTNCHIHTPRATQARREGYVLEGCFACHRPNALMAARAGAGLRTLPTENGIPVMQPSLVR